MAQGETLRAIIAIIEREAPYLTAEQLDEISVGISKDMGGRRWYIRARPPKSARTPEPKASTGAASQGGPRKGSPPREV